LRNILSFEKKLIFVLKSILTMRQHLKIRLGTQIFK
jgi:hypothetical protein